MDELNQKLLTIARLHEVQSNYEKTLLLLAALKAGTIDLNNVSLIEGGWNLVTPSPQAVLVPVDAIEAATELLAEEAA